MLWLLRMGGRSGQMEDRWRCRFACPLWRCWRSGDGWKAGGGRFLRYVERQVAPLHSFCTGFFKMCSVSLKSVSRENRSPQADFWIAGKSVVAHLSSVSSFWGFSQHGAHTLVPTRGHLGSIKLLMTGDVYIGRRTSQRNLSQSLRCNTRPGYSEISGA